MSYMHALVTTQSLTVVIVLVAALLLIILILGLRGRITTTRGFCAACRYLLHDPLPKRCPECGRELDQPRAIAWGVYAARRRMVNGAVVALVALWIGAGFLASYGYIGLGAGSGQPRVDRTLLRLNAEELTAQLTAAEPTDEIWRKMSPLVNSPRFDEERAISVGRAAIAAGRGSLKLAMQGERVHQHIGSHIEHRVVNSDHLSDEQRIDLILKAFEGPVVALPRLVPADSELRVVAAIPSVDHYFSLNFIGRITPIIERVQIDGNDVPFTRNREREAATTTMAQLELPPHKDSFELTVEAAFEVTFSERLGPWARAHLRNGSIRLNHVSVTESVLVIAEDAPFPQPLADESLVAAVKESLIIRRLGLLPDIEPGRLVYELDLAVRPVEGVELAFDIFIEAVDESGESSRVYVGRTSQYRRGGAYYPSPTDVPVSSQQAAWAPELGPEVRAVSVQFVPREPYRRNIRRWSGRDYVFDLPIRFENVPFVRHDLDWVEGGDDS